MFEHGIELLTLTIFPFKFYQKCFPLTFARFEPDPLAIHTKSRTTAALVHVLTSNVNY